MVMCLTFQIEVSSFPPSSYQYRLLQTDKTAIKLNDKLHSSEFVCGIIKIAIICHVVSICMWNHQDSNYMSCSIYFIIQGAYLLQIYHK